MKVINLNEYKKERDIKDKQDFFTNKYNQYKAFSLTGKLDKYESFKRWLGKQGIDYSCVTEYGVYEEKNDIVNKYESIHASLERVNKIMEQMRK